MFNVENFLFLFIFVSCWLDSVFGLTKISNRANNKKTTKSQTLLINIPFHMIEKKNTQNM